MIVDTTNVSVRIGSVFCVEDSVYYSMGSAKKTQSFYSVRNPKEVCGVH